MLPAYIIVKLYLKVIREITLQFESPFKLFNSAPRGRDSGSFLWKNIGPGWVEFANVLRKCPGVPRGQPPGMAADKRIKLLD